MKLTKTIKPVAESTQQIQKRKKDDTKSQSFPWQRDVGHGGFCL